jgi:hypothetical protein
MHQLSKREKKIARRCIDKGLDAEFREGLEISAAIIQDWRSGRFESNRAAYHALYKAISTKDRAIGRRYDRLSGSHWLMAVAAIFSDGYINEGDIEDFSDEAKAVIRFFNKE